MITAEDVRFLLRKSVTFHRALADIAGGATGGLFLSQLLYWSDRGRDPDGWIYKTQDQWEEETALTRSEQERARKALRDKGILEEWRRGVPARLYYRLDLVALARMLDSASKNAGSKRTRMQDSTIKKADSPQASPLDAANLPAESDEHIYTENTTEITQETTTHQHQQDADELLFVGQVTQALQDYGVIPATAKQLGQRDSDLAAAWMEWLVSLSQAERPNTPAAFLVAKLKAGEQPPRPRRRGWG